MGPGRGVCALFALLAACADKVAVGEPPPAGGAKPKAAVEVPAPRGLAYGEHPRQRLDLWRGQGRGARPLLLFIHGGAFVAGDKSEITQRPEQLLRWLEAGVSVASLNYRFRHEAPVQDILRDCARAVQFLRARAAELELDPARFVAWGGSAGGGAALWLAFRDDLADPRATDAVLRQSSRLAAAAAFDAQFSYDLIQWPEVVGGTLAMLGGGALPSFYGLGPGVDLESPAGRRARGEVDVRRWISADDPPVFLGSSSPAAPPTNQSELTHHLRHTQALEERCKREGVRVVVEHSHPSLKRAPTQPFVEFLAEHLGVARPATR